MFKNYKPSKYTSYILFFLPLFFALFMNFSRESDTWFLLSHGRYVLNYGIPYKEILSMHTDFSFVMQQWLSSVVFYSIYRLFGDIGLYIFYLFMNALITFLVYKLCMIISNKKIYASTLVSVIAMLLLQINFIEVRPQLFSFSVLLILMMILEIYYKNSETKFIYFLPVLAILLINFHAAFFPIFIIICMPYIAEYLYNYLKYKDKKIVKLLLIILISILVSFINPYGLKAITYGINSYGGGNTNNFVLEMMPFDLSNKKLINDNMLFLCVFLIVNTIMIYAKKKDSFNIHTILFIYGFFFMGLLALKNMSFYFLFALPFLSKFISVKDGKDNNIPYKTYIILGVILLSFFGYNIYNKAYKLSSGIEDIISYLNKNTNKNITIYSGYNNGPYLEFEGYKPYIDTRAEVFIKENNKCEDVLLEYFNLNMDNMDLFINKYKFDYILVSKKDNLYRFIKNKNDYDLVYKGKDKNTYLFKRKCGQR